MKKPWRLSTTDLSPPIRAYLLVNFLFGAALLLLFLYVLVYSPETGTHPIPCVYTKMTGEQCASCGLSRGLSHMIRGNFQAATAINRHSPAIFLFFAMQLLLRLTTSLMAIRKSMPLKYLTITDAFIAATTFLLAFLPLLLN